MFLYSPADLGFRVQDLGLRIKGQSRIKNTSILGGSGGLSK